MQFKIKGSFLKTIGKRQAIKKAPDWGLWRMSAS